MISTQKTHVIERTSPLGEPFVGTCTLCGTAGLTTAQVHEPCSNPARVSANDAVVSAIEGPSDPPRTGASEPELPRVCWRCLTDESNPSHDPEAHSDCPAWCTHHSYEYEPTSRTGLLNHVGALLFGDLRLRSRTPAPQRSRSVRMTGSEHRSMTMRALDLESGGVRIVLGDGWPGTDAHPPVPEIEAWLREENAR